MASTYERVRFMAFPLLEIGKQPRLMALMTNRSESCVPEARRRIKPEAPRTRLHPDDSDGLSYRAAAAEDLAAHGGRDAEHNVACGRLLPDRRGANAGCPKGWP